jgi:hypothetical protein
MQHITMPAFGQQAPSRHPLVAYAVLRAADNHSQGRHRWLRYVADKRLIEREGQRLGMTRWKIDSAVAAYVLRAEL